MWHFGTIKEGIIELLNEWLRDLRAEIVAGQIRAQTLSFPEFKAC